MCSGFHPEQLRPQAFRLPNRKITMLPTCRITTRPTGIESAGGFKRNIDGIEMAGWGVAIVSLENFSKIICGLVVCGPRLPAFLGATSCSNNTAELTGFASAFRWANSFIPRGARLRILFYSKHGKRNMSLARTCNELWLRLNCNFHVSAHHVSGHAGNTGNECADAAASLGTRGFVSEKNVPIFRPERGFFCSTPF